ncbi:hypothetical protein HDU82_006048 [Entophlyctis luteolus]|nr:hypothetical protein HDU82_006048 [Entophlyctis luteolus]
MPTDIAFIQFANDRVLLIISQTGTIGGSVTLTAFDRTNLADLNTDSESSQAASVATLLGPRDDALLHVFATHLLDVVARVRGARKTELVLSLSLRRSNKDTTAAEAGDVGDVGAYAETLRALSDLVSGLAKA